MLVHFGFNYFTLWLWLRSVNNKVTTRKKYMTVNLKTIIVYRFIIAFFIKVYSLAVITCSVLLLYLLKTKRKRHNREKERKKEEIIEKELNNK